MSGGAKGPGMIFLSNKSNKILIVWPLLDKFLRF